ncbi:MAG: transcription elongation factor GreA [Clostridia bacterium]|nr:transcription elongation factor GreA [Clostridia bacterium]
MGNKQVLITLEGLKKLEEELEYLKSVRRREVAERIRQAVEYGDITDNSEFEDAKREQVLIENRIMALEKKLRNAQVVDEEQQTDPDVITLGSEVVLEDLADGQAYEFKLVSSADGETLENVISSESPAGQAILGQTVGAVVEVRAPKGLVKYKILEVRRPG